MERLKKIRCLRSQKYCIHPALGPVVYIEEGHVGEYPFDFAFDMIEAGAFEGVVENIIEDIPDEDDDIEIETTPGTLYMFLNDIVDEADDEDEAKDALIDYAVQEYSLKLDKRYGIKRMIEKILEESEE